MSDIEYRVISTDFDDLGFFFKQISRDGDFAIYERYGGKPPYHLSKGSVPALHWEVIIIQRHDGFKYKIKGQEISGPPSEYYPSPELWGAKAWTYNNKEKAFDKFNQLISARNAKP